MAKFESLLDLCESGELDFVIFGGGERANRGSTRLKTGVLFLFFEEQSLDIGRLVSEMMDAELKISVLFCTGLD